MDELTSNSPAVLQATAVGSAAPADMSDQPAIGPAFRRLLDLPEGVPPEQEAELVADFQARLEAVSVREQEPPPSGLPSQLPFSFIAASFVVCSLLTACFVRRLNRSEAEQLARLDAEAEAEELRRDGGIWGPRGRPTRRQQAVMSAARHAVSHVYDGESWRAIRRIVEELGLRSDEERQLFRGTANLNAMTRAIPIQRADVPDRMSALIAYAGGDRKAKPSQNSAPCALPEPPPLCLLDDDESDSACDCDACDGPPALRCPNGHTFPVCTCDASAYRGCPECGAQVVVPSAADVLSGAVAE